MRGSAGGGTAGAKERRETMGEKRDRWTAEGRCRDCGAPLDKPGASNKCARCRSSAQPGEPSPALPVVHRGAALEARGAHPGGRAGSGREPGGLDRGGVPGVVRRGRAGRGVTRPPSYRPPAALPLGRASSCIRGFPPRSAARFAYRPGNGLGLEAPARSVGGERAPRCARTRPVGERTGRGEGW